MQRWPYRTRIEKVVAIQIKSQFSISLKVLRPVTPHLLFPTHELPKAFSNLLSGSLEGLKPCRGELINIFSWTNRYRELLTKN
ncbi:hypothetical protein PUN28_019443 [Cardiocondyla obscurior]|uniref:Uncharacterized protein n=1 Tax=Cardiocondyla obscurior TaxID=286306 RepID=A0AAW2EFE4_9HYME